MESETRQVQLGTQWVDFPSSDLMPLIDCNHLLGNREVLQTELKEKGYLFIRGLHDRDEVLAARLAVLRYIQDSGEGKLKVGHPWEDGLLNQRCGVGCVPFMEGKNDITHSEPVLKIIEGPRPHSFFKTLFNCDAKTFDYKWLRAMHNEGFTGAHVDRVYMGRGSQELLTMWTPIGDVTMDMGTLAVCEGSHTLSGFQYFQETYGNIDVEEVNLNGTGWFTSDPFEISKKFGGQWKTTDYKAGDVLIFGIRTVHMSTVNNTELARISCDTRWLAANEVSDPRFTGELFRQESKFGVHSSQTKRESSQVTIEELRTKWDLQ